MEAWPDIKTQIYASNKCGIPEHADNFVVLQIWPLYLKWVRATDVKETTMKVYRRYLKLEPTRCTVIRKIIVDHFIVSSM